MTLTFFSVSHGLMAHQKGLKFFDSSYLYILTQELTKKVEFFIGSDPQFGPSKQGPTKNDHPLFIIESFSTIKTNMFAKKYRL